jgi:SOS-response transcriptional repressor LexA
VNNLRELRRKKGLTQDELGSYLGVQKAAVCKYETGRTALPEEIILSLCDLFKVSADYLLGRDDETPFERQTALRTGLFKPLKGAVSVPVLGRVHAGLPILADENISEYVSVSENEVAGGDYFYMEVEGDCMIGEHILEGSLVLIRKQSRVENGQIAVVRVGDEVLLRKVKWIDGRLLLFPSNPKYEPIVISHGDAEIIGRIVEIRIRGL